MTGRTPVRELGRRAPEQGRIRTGKKSEKGYPQKIDKFRFTSADHDALEQVAAKYGGTVVPWKDAPGHGDQWQVFTTSDRISVALEDGCLGDGPVYELWAGGYCTRRCDGESCEQPQDGPDGPEMVPGPCVCDTERGPAKCKGKLRLNVVLTDIPFGGTWRLETSSEHALRELPGMVDMILAMKAGGLLTSATLLLKQRQSVKYVKGKAQTQNYGVPTLAVPHSLDDLASGAAKQLGYGAPGTPAAAIGSGSHPALEPDPGGGDEDDTVHEAEIVEPMSDEQHEALRDAADVVATAWNVDHPEEPLTAQSILQSAAGMLTGDPQQQVAKMDVEHGEKVAKMLADITRGDVEFRGIQAGRIKVRR